LNKFAEVHPKLQRFGLILYKNAEPLPNKQSIG